jgi:hypothetical protein
MDEVMLENGTVFNWLMAGFVDMVITCRLL